MKKLGFTIAEVLISLVLIGVVASLTMPLLVSENQKKTQAAKLSVAVSNFETAMRSMMAAEDVTELYDTRAWKELSRELTNFNKNNALKFMGNIGEYLELTDYSGSITNFYSTDLPLKGINNEIFPMGRFDTDLYAGFKATGGVAYFIYIWDSTHGENKRISQAEANREGVSLQEEAAKVIIDVNGAAKPNMIGRDIFFFQLGSDGVLYPFGGRDVAKYEQGSVDRTWNGVGGWSCTDNTKSNFGVGCTARLIENGYNMDY